MIKVNELRIGNLVMTNNSKYRKEQNGKVAYITQIDSERNFEELNCTVSIYLIEDKWKDTYGQWLIFIEPIPITEEWLLNFGFEKVFLSKYRSKFNHNEFHFIGYEFLHVNDNSLMYGFTYYGRYLNNIEYVHQLQNLYFALTNKEL